MMQPRRRLALLLVAISAPARVVESAVYRGVATGCNLGSRVQIPAAMHSGALGAADFQRRVILGMHDPCEFLVERSKALDEELTGERHFPC
jgi:hypothetical protein